MKNLRKLEVWREYIDNVNVEINSWPNEHLKPLTKSWTYYVTIHESYCKDFEKLWLEDKEVQFGPTPPKHITHDYYIDEFNNLKLHYGITYYEKGGQLKGHRYVKVGCDYSHLGDMERGYDFTLEQVYAEATYSARLVKETLFKNEPTP